MTENSVNIDNVNGPMSLNSAFHLAANCAFRYFMCAHVGHFYRILEVSLTGHMIHIPSFQQADP